MIEDFTSGAWKLPAALQTRDAAAAAAEPTELLTWHDAATTKPDSDTTVLCIGAEGDWFAGWWADDDGTWRECTSGAAVEGIMHWAQPSGPEA